MTPQENLERLRVLLERKLTPKAKGQGLSRSTRVNPLNRERKEKLNAAAFGPCSRLARLIPCVVKTCRSMPPGDPAHIRSRGAGGGDWNNVVGMCRAHHSEQHDCGVPEFERRYSLDLVAEANRLALRVSCHECSERPERAKNGTRCHVCLKASKAPVGP